MKLSDYKEEYYQHTGKASDINRQLAFAGIAVIWVFRITMPNSSDTIREELVLPLALIVISLAADFLQYVYKSIIWGRFYRKNEKQLIDKDEDPELEAPSWYNYPSNVFFYSKIVILMGAYWFIIKFLIETLVNQTNQAI